MRARPRVVLFTVLAGALAVPTVAWGTAPSAAVVPSAIPAGCVNWYSGVVSCSFVAPTGDTPLLFDVPAEVYSIRVTARGAYGGSRYNQTGTLLAAGGAGQTVATTLAVDPGRDLEIRVGAMGAYVQSAPDVEPDPDAVPGDGGPSSVRVAGSPPQSASLVVAVGGDGAGTPVDGAGNDAGDGHGDGGVYLEWHDAQEPQTTVTLIDTDFNATQTYRFTASHPRVRFECSLDAGGWTSCVSPLRVGKLKDGSHLLQVRAIDFAGRVGNPGSDGDWVDTKAPNTKLNPGRGVDPRRPRQIYVNVFSNDRDTTWFECKVDDGKWKTCSKKYKRNVDWSTKKLKPGKHTVRVRALDWAGNADPTPVKRSVVIR